MNYQKKWLIPAEDLDKLYEKEDSQSKELFRVGAFLNLKLDEINRKYENNKSIYKKD